MGAIRRSPPLVSAAWPSTLPAAILAGVLATPAVVTGAEPDVRTPSAIVERATRAVEVANTAPLERAWSAARRADPDAGEPLLGLATLARLTFRNALAESLHTLLIRRRPGDAFTAYGYLGRGLGYVHRDVRDSAIVWLAAAHDAALRIGDGSVRVLALVERAPLESYLNRHALAESLLRAASRVAPAADIPLQMRLTCARAFVGVRRGDPRAVAWATRGAALADRHGDRRLATRCRAVAAEGRARAGDYDALWNDLRLAADRAASLRDPYLEGSTRVLRGALLISYGVVGAAQYELRVAAALARRTGNANLEAWALANESQTYYYLGDPEAAGERARRAIELFGRGYDPRGRAFSTALRADIATADGDFAGAASGYEQSAVEFGAAGYPMGVAHASGLLAGLALRYGDLERAEQLLRHAWQIMGPAHASRRPEMDLQLGTLALRRGRLAEAEAYLSRGRAGEVAGGDFRYYCDARLAELRLLRGDTAAAEELLRDAADALDAWRARLPDTDLRPMAFEASQDEADPDLGVATILAAVARRGRVAQAFTLAEQRRARNLHDRMLRLDGLRTVPDDTSAGRRIAVPQPRLSADQVRAALPADIALIEFVTGTGGEPTTVLLLSRTVAAAFVTDPVDSLDVAVGLLTDSLWRDYEALATARRLGTSLLEPSIRALPSEVTTLILVPDGALHRLPFDALVIGGGRRVFERFATAVAPSAAVALELLRRPSRREAPAVLAFGDPVFPGPSRDDGNDVLRSGFAKSGGLPRLRASAVEARRAAGFGEVSRVLVRGRASEAALRRTALQRFRVIHFATHALVDERSAARTALALAPGDGEDGFVGPADLAALSMPVDVVVLSACRTARGRVLRGEGMQGLTAPLLMAGARAVLATQWPIADRATSRTTELFYRALAEGASAGQALQDARRRLLAAGASPAQWSAFVLVGDPTVHVPLRHSPKRPDVGVAVGAGLVLLVVLLFAWYRRGRGAPRVPGSWSP